MASKAQSENIETRYRTCPFCEATCGLEVEIDTKTRRLISVRGHDDDPLSEGYLCPKAVALKDLDEDPDRLRTPMVRKGGNLQPATWEEAFAEIKRRALPILKEHGPLAAGIYLGNPNAHKAGLAMSTGAMTQALQTPNVFSASTLDQMPKQLVAGLLYGAWLSIPVPDIDRTDLLVIVGGNPCVSNGSMWTVPNFRGRAKRLIKRGGEMVVIDPKKTQTAKLASQHLPIRPGTDVFLFLAMIHTLLHESLVDLGACEDLTEVPANLKDLVAPFTPATAAARTGIPEDEILNLTRKLAATPRSALYCRMGASVTEFGTLANWAVDVINILTGSMDREGGLMWPKASAFQFNTSGPEGSGKGVRMGRRKSRVRGAPELMGEFPAVCLTEEIETPGDGQIRLLFTVAGNPVLSAPGGDRLSRALDTLDFMVSIDIYLNETTRHADVILPGISPLEDFHFPTPFQQLAVRNVTRFSPPLFDVAETQWPEWKIMYQLALILSGQDEAIGPDQLFDIILDGRIKSAIGQHPELEDRTTDELKQELIDLPGPAKLVDLGLRTGPYGDLFGARPDGVSAKKLAASPGGADLGPLAPRLPEMLRTPDGRIDLLPEMIAKDLPRAAAALEAAEPSDASLMMIGRRNTRTNNSWMHNLPTLAKGKFKGALEINPADAEARGLKSGDRVRVANDDGAVEIEVEVTEDIAPGTITLPHGFGHVFSDTNMGVAAANPGVNSNLLASLTRIDPLSGNAHLNAIQVSVTSLP